MYVTNYIEVENEKIIVKLKWEAKTKLALGKRTREVITQQVVKRIIEGLREATLVSVRCFNDCGLTREVAPSRYPLLSDNWIGCTVLSKLVLLGNQVHCTV